MGFPLSTLQNGSVTLHLVCLKTDSVNIQEQDFTTRAKTPHDQHMTIPWSAIQAKTK